MATQRVTCSRGGVRGAQVARPAAIPTSLTRTGRAQHRRAQRLQAPRAATVGRSPSPTATARVDLRDDDSPTSNGLFTATDPEVRRIVPTEAQMKGKTKVIKVFSSNTTELSVASYPTVALCGQEVKLQELIGADSHKVVGMYFHMCVCAVLRSTFFAASCAFFQV